MCICIKLVHNLCVIFTMYNNECNNFSCTVLTLRWSHLNDILRKILSERPENVIEYFEEYSRQVKQERYIEQSGYIRDVFMPPEQLEYSTKQLELLEVPSQLKYNKYYKMATLLGTSNF